MGIRHLLALLFLLVIIISISEHKAMAATWSDVNNAYNAAHTKTALKENT